MKTIFNPDRSTFTQLYNGQEYVVPPGKSRFPDKVADHLVESLKMWAVVHWVGEESEMGARVRQVSCLKAHFQSILDAYLKANKDELAAAAVLGLKIAIPPEVEEARTYLNIVRNTEASELP